MNGSSGSNIFVMAGIFLILGGVGAMASLTFTTLSNIDLPFNMTIEIPLLLSAFSTVLGMISLAIGLSSSKFMKGKLRRRRGR